MNLRKAAQSQVCIMCGRDDSTTVLHHIRAGGNAGMGQKPPDYMGIDVCADCHRYCHHEGRTDYKAQLVAYQRQVERWLEDGRLMFT